MRILVISDLHSSNYFLTRLKAYLSKNKFDLCLIPGDITIHNQKAIDYIQDLSDLFKQHKLQWYCVHGNNDPAPVIDFTIGAKRNLHYDPQEFEGYKLMGIGGWGNDLPHYPLTMDNKTIFVTHIPPKIIHPPKDRPTNLSNSPLIHLSGHSHTKADFTDLGPTRVIRIPAAMNFRGAILELPSRNITFISFPPAQLLS